MTFRERRKIEYHSCDLVPPDEHRLFWLVKCSNGDLVKSERNKVQALALIYEHFLTLTLQQALADGTYEFDDSSIDDVRLKEIAQIPLDVVDIRYFGVY